jgi:hypothetical protein
MRENARLIVLVAVAIALDAALLVLPPGPAILDARLHWGADDASALFAALGRRAAPPTSVISASIWPSLRPISCSGTRSRAV